MKGTSLLKLLDPASNATAVKHFDHAHLSSIKDLQATFGYFHERGAGGERYMSDNDAFQLVLKTAQSISNAQVSFFRTCSFCKDYIKRTVIPVYQYYIY